MKILFVVFFVSVSPMVFMNCNEQGGDNDTEQLDVNENLINAVESLSEELGEEDEAVEDEEESDEDTTSGDVVPSERPPMDLPQDDDEE